MVKSLIQRVEVGDAKISVRLNRTAVVPTALPEAKPRQTDCKTAVEPAMLSIAAGLRRAGKGTRFVIGNGSANKIDSGLASLIARAIATRSMLLAAPDDSIRLMASRLGVRRDYLTVLVRLSYLSPEIVRAILVGQSVNAAPDGRHVAAQLPSAGGSARNSPKTSSSSAKSLPKSTSDVASTKSWRVRSPSN
jgi:site-specific DNA recombinase